MCERVRYDDAVTRKSFGWLCRRAKEWPVRGGCPVLKVAGHLRVENSKNGEIHVGGIYLCDSQYFD